MIPKFKERISFHGLLLDAAKRRILDTPHAADINEDHLHRIAGNLLRGLKGFKPGIPGTSLPISSFKEISFLKDFKLYLNIINSQVGRLEEVVRSDSKEAVGLLQDMQREVVTINAEVEEKEIELLGNYSQVTLNNFSRSTDGQLEFTDKSWLIDFKTGFSFMEKYLMDIIPSSGAVLPIKEYVKLPIVNAEIIDERCDTGDSVKPFILSNPRNVFLKNKIFKYAVVRQEFDTSSRRYRVKTSFDEFPYSCTSTMTIQVELGNLLQANTLKIEPVGDSTVTVKSVKYVNESGEEVLLNSSSIQTHTETVLMFEPVVTKYFIIEFQQLAHLSKTTVRIGDKRAKSINKLLNSSGFTLNLPYIENNISGRVYDFSLRDIEVGLSAYENKGIFRGEPTIVSSPVGMEIQASLESIVPGVEFSTYMNLAVLPEGDALNEVYAGVRLFDKEGNRRVDTICPLLDSGLVQLEFLAPVSEICKYKLFPDLDWTSQKICITNMQRYDVCEEDFANAEITELLTMSSEEFGPDMGGFTSSEAETVMFQNDFEAKYIDVEDSELLLEQQFEKRYYMAHPASAPERVWQNVSLEGIRIVTNEPVDIVSKPIDKEIVKRFNSKGLITPNSAMTTFVKYSVSDEVLKSFFTETIYNTINPLTKSLIKADPILFLGIGGKVTGSSTGGEVVVEGKRLYSNNVDSSRRLFSIKRVNDNSLNSLNKEYFEFEITLADSLKRKRSSGFSKRSRDVVNHLKKVSDLRRRIDEDFSLIPSDPDAFKRVKIGLAEERNVLLSAKFGYKWDSKRKNTIFVEDPEGQYWPSPKLARMNKNQTREMSKRPTLVNVKQFSADTSFDFSSMNPAVTGTGYVPEDVERIAMAIEMPCPDWNAYYKITTDSPHGLVIGDIATYSLPDSTDYDGLSLVVVHVTDEYSYWIAIDDDSMALINAYAELGSGNICFFGNQQLTVDLLEVYKNNKLLEIGEDYEISMDDGSSWYNEWPTATILNSHFYRKAGAGRFFVKLLDYDRSNIYWTKYLVKRNQYLSSCKQINLKNGRVVFDEELRFTTGTLQPVVITRTNSMHPYVTNILREFYIAVQTRNIENNATANVTKDFIKTYLSGDSLNGS